jgi:CRISPR-associated protein Csd1
MLLKQLVDYAERLEQENSAREEQDTVVPSGHQMQPIKGFIKLDLEGNFLEFYPTDGGKGKKDKGKEFPAPHIARAAGIKAKLLADNAEYAYGFAKKENDPKTQDRHTAFIQAIQDCYDATQNSLVKTVLTYLSQPERPDQWEGFDPNLNYSFEVDNQFPFEHKDVQVYWSQKAMGGTPTETDSTLLMPKSLISGLAGPIMEREPVKMKGIPDGQTAGMNFISANAPAFISYGMEASQIAPVLISESEKYANGLNRLLSGEKTHLRLGSVVYAFWTKQGEMFPLRDAFSDPVEAGLIDLFDEANQPTELVFANRAEQVRESLKSIWTGQKKLDPRPTAFYAVGLSASGSRIVVRHHIVTTVEEVLGKLGNFFAAQKMIASRADEPDRPHGVYALASSLYRDFRKESSTFDLDALLAYALEGNQILPHHFLQRLSARNRAEKRVTYPRAVLTKMVLISRKELSMGQLEELQMDYPHIGYQLGRLLAALDNIQESVMKANTTLVDRFYGSMSTTPKAVWGRLIQGTQHHLAKLRKDKPGVYYIKQKMLEEINSRILPQDIPNVLSLEGQALFSLGYYHQRAAIAQEIQDAREAKALRADAGKQAPLENQQENEND